MVKEKEMPDIEGEDRQAPDAAPSAADANAISMVQKIEKALGGDSDEEVLSDKNSFEFPLSEAMGLLPKHYLKNVSLEDIAGETIAISVNDLFEQLAGGKLSMTISGLSYFIPVYLIYRAAFDDTQPVELSLPTVIGYVGLDVLKDRIPEKTRWYDIDGIEDMFFEDRATSEDLRAVAIEDEESVKIDEEPAEAKATKPGKPEPAVEEQAPVKDKEPPAADEVSEEAQPAPIEEAVTEKTAEAFSFGYSASEALRLMPEEYLTADALTAAGETTITIDVPDLYDQLKQGKVTIAAGTLAGLLSADLVTDQARNDRETAITLSLSTVVDAVGLDALKERTPTQTKEYDIERIADPFKEPDELPKLTKPPKPARVAGKAGGVKPIAPSAAGAVVENAAFARTQVMRYVPSEDAEAELKYRELPGNVNINAASVEELLILGGMTESIAGAIIEYRDKHNGFKSIFQLQDVPGIGKAAFRQMTGVSPERKRYHRRKRLAGLLKIPPEQITDLNLVADRIAGKVGFSGCIIADKEGLVLAQSGIKKFGEDLCAIVPRMIRRIRRDMDLIGAGRVGTISLSIEGVFYTIVAAENVALTAVHEENLISATELSFIRKVGSELAWLLSLRAYVGPKV